MTDVETLVSDAQAKGTFSVLDAAKGRSYPEDDATIYLDAAAGYEFNRLDTAVADGDDDDAINLVDKQRDALRAQIKASGLTFHLRGVAPGFVQALSVQAAAQFPPVEDEDENARIGAERVQWFENSLWVEHVVNVTNAAGEIDEHRWTVDEVAEFRKAIPEEADDKIMGYINNLSFASVYFDAAVSADFS